MIGKLRIAFFKDFKGEDTVLLSGDAEAMKSLLDIVQDIASGRTERLHLESLPFVEAQVSIVAERSTASSGLRYSSKSPLSFSWRLSPDDWEDVSLRMVALLEHASGHQYFDYLGVLDDARLMVSMNEYTDEWWTRHG